MAERSDAAAISRLVAATLVASAFVLGLVGWSWELGIAPALWPGILLSTMRLYFARPDLVMDAQLNPVLRVAAFMGGISGFIAGFALWLAAANQTLAGLYTRFLRRNHVVVAGNTSFAVAIAEAINQTDRRAILAVDGETGAPSGAVGTPLTFEGLAKHAGLRRAAALVLDGGGDARTLSLAKPVLVGLAREGSGNPGHVALRVSDPVVADRLTGLVARSVGPSALRISVFDDRLVLARRTLARDPLFIRADARRQERVHAVIVGFGELGEKLLDQVFLTSIAGRLGMPTVTVIDQNAATLERAFDARRPGVRSNLPITFHSLCLGQDVMEGPGASAALADLASLEQSEPITMIYLALPDAGVTMRAALLLQRHRKRTGQFVSPITYRCFLGADNADLFEYESVPPASDGGLIRMVISGPDMAAAVLDARDREDLARRLHDHYRSGPGVSAAADVPWQELGETYRRANMRAVDHLPAKLWTLGIDPKRASRSGPLSAADRALLEELPSNALRELARIEHDRWSVDRWLDGWRLGDVRDDERQIHPDLVPFETLEKLRPKEIDKDIEQSLAAISALLEPGTSLAGRR